MTRSSQINNVARNPQQPWTVCLLLLLFCSFSGCCTFRSAAIDDRIARARELTFHGLNALHHGKCNQAQEFLSRAAQSCPTDQRIRQHLATALVEQGQIDQAVEHLEIALQHSSDDPQLHVKLGNLYLIKKQPHIAEEHAEAALQQNRQMAAAWLLKGRSQKQQDDLAGALASFHRAANFEPEVSETQLEIARTYRQLGQPMQALTSLEIYAQQYPAHQISSKVRLLIGQTLTDLNQFQRAISTLVNASEQSDAGPEVWVALSQAQLQAGDSSNARLTIMTAEHKFPGNELIIGWSENLAKRTRQPLQAAHEIRQ